MIMRKNILVILAVLMVIWLLVSHIYSYVGFDVGSNDDDEAIGHNGLITPEEDYDYDEIVPANAIISATIVLNALDGGSLFNICNFLHSTKRALRVAQALRSSTSTAPQQSNVTYKYDYHLFGFEEHWSGTDMYTRRCIKTYIQPTNMHYFKTVPIKMRGYDSPFGHNDQLANKTQYSELFTPILESMTTMLSSYQHDHNGTMLFLSFDEHVDMAPTSIYPKWIQQLSYGYYHKDVHIKLLGKNKRFTSVSDWHDFMIVSIRWRTSNHPAQQWLQLVRSLYLQSAIRTVYQLLDPRFAIRESMVRVLPSAQVQIEYFKRHEFVSFTSSRDSDGESDHAAADSRTHKHALEIRCSSRPHLNTQTTAPADTHGDTHADTHTDTQQHQQLCHRRYNHHQHLILDSPVHWKMRVKRKIPADYVEKADGSLETEKWEARQILDTLELGLLRFRNASGRDVPRSFCWETGLVKLMCVCICLCVCLCVGVCGLLLMCVSCRGQTEKLADARIYSSPTNYTTYMHPHLKQQQQQQQQPTTTTKLQRPSRIVHISSTAGRGDDLERFLYVSISKMYHAKRYNLEHGDSNSASSSSNSSGASADWLMTYRHLVSTQFEAYFRSGLFEVADIYWFWRCVVQYLIECVCVCVCVCIGIRKGATLCPLDISLLSVSYCKISLMNLFCS
jgi:hypothetical protein